MYLYQFLYLLSTCHIKYISNIFQTFEIVYCISNYFDIISGIKTID